jgi:biotin carboxyl carrier protein
MTTRFLDDRDAFLNVESNDVPLDVKFLAAGALVASDRAWRIAGVGIPVDLIVDGAPLRASLVRHGERWLTEGELGPGFAVESRGSDVIVVAGSRTITGDVRLDAEGGRIVHNGRAYGFVFTPPPDADPRRRAAAVVSSGDIRSPMPGKIVSVSVAAGDVVEARALLIVLEAMKMEHRIEAPAAGTVEAVHVRTGDIVSGDAQLVTLGA